MSRFENKVVLVTGAARGQGRSHAVRFAAEGADVAILDICRQVHEHVAYPPATPEDLEQTAEMVTKYRGRVVARQADVRHYDQVCAVVGEAIATFGGIDIVVANAGVCMFEWSWEIAESAWDATIDTNLKGVWNTVRATVPSMVSAGQGGSIIITSAAAEVRDHPLVAHYATSKVGQVGLMRVLSTELAQYNIRVNTVNPLGVNTPMATGPAAAGVEETVATLRPAATDLTRVPWAEPDDVSDVVLYLASAEASSITGVQMPVEPKK